MLLRGVAAWTVVVVLVAVPVAELLADAGDGIAVGAWHGERSRLLHDGVCLHACEFEAVALGCECQINGELVKCNQAFRDSHEVIRFAGRCRKQ